MLAIRLILTIFVLLDLNAGTYRRPQTYGQFFCPIGYDGDVLPCSICDGSDGPGKGSSNGKGITVYYLMPVMLKNLLK